ncbi:MAG TPA: tetratricopeptide repeat protein, partial [Candidatus Polarisedimenticolia bacterium]|nr:tetratricopeptide repeat protein [Candidatus Polarisedimenticolia bacterium]
MSAPRSVPPIRRPSAIALAALVLALGAPARGRADEPGAPRVGSPESRPPSVADLIKQGNEARRAGQMREAIASFRRARDLAPQTYEIRALLADTLRRTGEQDRALSEYEAARRIDPTRPEGYSGPALIARQRYDFERAAGLLQEGLANVADGSKPELQLVLAETRRRQGRLEEAERLFRTIQGARPGEAPAQAGLAKVAEDRGDLPAAIRSWDAYLEIKPDDDAAALRRQELRELRASIEALRETAARAGDARVLTELGRLQWVAGDATAAVESYRRALRGADRAEARRGLALALRDSGGEAAAESAREFRRILKKEPGDGLALYNLVAIAAAGPSGEEEGAWRAAVSARPDDLFALRGYVQCLDRQEPAARKRLIERALADVREAASPALLRRRALLLATAGRSPEAAEALDRLLLQDPTDPWSLGVANEILFLDPGILTLVAERERGSPVPASTEREVLRAR